MSVKWKKTGKTTGELTFDISKDEIKLGLDQAFRRVKKNLRVPGFRKGHVSRVIFDQYYGEEALYQEALNDLLPQRIIPLIIKLSGIQEDKKVNVITKEERKKLVHIIKNIKMNIKGLRPIEEAIVTAGGVNTLEIDPSTMKSKMISNLSFAGEVIDVDAFTGGYNVQIALSTGYIAGSNI